MASRAEALQQVEIPAPGRYDIDKSHSRFGFVARHLMVTKVRGAFDEYDATVDIGSTPELSSVEIRFKAASVSTGDPKRDEHLRSADFFDIENHPELVFKSTKVTQTGPTSLLVEGDFTVGGVTKPIAFDVQYEGATAAPWGGWRYGFSAEAEIDREDWGLTWNVALETGGVLVGKKIKIEIDVELAPAQ